MKLSLTAKGLILVSIPLCCEIGFVALLVFFLGQAEAETKHALEARDLSDRINRLSGYIYQSYILATHEDNDSKQRMSPEYIRDFAIKFRVAVKNVRSQLDDIDKLASETPGLCLPLRNAMHAVDEIDKIADQSIEQVNSGHMLDFLASRQQKHERIKNLFRLLLSQDLDLIAEQERRFAATSDVRQREIRGRIIFWALAAILANVALSLCLAIFLVRNITARVQILGENAKRIPQDIDLHPRLEGSDEIAQLDGAIHNMASDIKDAQRMREDFVNMLTHDLRSPLTTVQLGLEMLEDGKAGELNERGERLVRMALRNSGRMMNLINDLLDVQKIKAGMMTIDLAPVSIGEVFEEVKLNVDDWISENGLQLAIQSTTLRVKGDREKLSRILFNLLSNAVKFSPRGGTITVAAFEKADRIEIAVKDEGAGIPTEKLPLLFKPFQQLHSNNSGKTAGTGLGLNICREFTRIQGGEIWATSEVGKGSVFHLSLPKA